jgi:hypothetical protein
MSTREEWRCHHCSEVIGVYEPMVVLHDGVAVRTSRAAAEVEPPSGKPCFHSECFASFHGDASARP